MTGNLVRRCCKHLCLRVTKQISLPPYGLKSDFDFPICVYTETALVWARPCRWAFSGRGRCGQQLPPDGRSLPGLSKSSGLNTLLIFSIVSKSSGENMSDKNSCFSIPIPCSPVNAPPAAIQARSTSPPACRTRDTSSGSRSSNNTAGCRLPSPA